MTLNGSTPEVVQLSFRIVKPLLQTVKIEAVKDDVSIQEWLLRLIRAELDKRGIVIDN